MWLRPYTLALFGSLVFCACDNGVPTDLASLTSDVLQGNGFSANGFSANGFSANGFSANGFSANGFSASGFSKNGWEAGGEPIVGLTLNNSLLTLTKKRGQVISGLGLIGAKANIQMANGESAKLIIEDVAVDLLTGIYQYKVTVNPADGKRQPLCTWSGTQVGAVPLPGIYDPLTGAYTPTDGVFTFACTDAALGKCALWGYPPWGSKRECSGGSCKTQSLAPWHAACVHMVRADYCGDGVPHTRNGTTINVWDPFGIQLQALTTWELEAEWTVSGAQCIRHTRWLKADTTESVTDLEYIQDNCPQRLFSSNPSGCDANRSNFLSANGLNADPNKRRLLRVESAASQ